MADDPLVRVWRSAAPLDVWRTLSTLRRGPLDPAFRGSGAEMWRTTRAPSGPVTLQLQQLDGRTVRALAWGPGAAEELEHLPTCLGGDAPPAPVMAHPVVADAHRRHPGLRVPRTTRVIEALVPAVIEQKVLGADAFLSWRQLLARHGEAAPGPAPRGMRVTPTARQWAALPSWEWHRAGVDPKRYRTAQAVARLGDALERLAARPAADAAAALTSLPGVGVWTAAEVASRAFGDTDAVPFGDYHLASTVGTALLGERLHHDHEVAEVLEPFAPHRFLALRLMQLSPHVVVERRGARMSRVDHRLR